MVGDAKALARSEAEQKIMDALAVLGEADAATIASHLEKSRQAADKVAKRMAKEGKLNTQVICPNRGGVKVLYSLKGDEQREPTPVPVPGVAPVAPLPPGPSRYVAL